MSKDGKKRKPTQAARSSANDAPDDTKTRANEPGQKERKHPLVNASAPGWVRAIVENAEALAVALIMALIVRQFAVEAFSIPSASMYPTLQGLPEFGRGDRVVVDKWAYLLGQPRRWDVTVFRYPLDVRRNFIKRLVGMPGDRLTVVDGDIWVNQHIERKPDRVQRSVWCERFPEPPAFAQRPDKCRFKVADAGWKGMQDQFVATPPAGQTVHLDLDFGLSIPMNGVTPPTYHEVRDYRVRGGVSAASGAVFEVEMKVRDLPFRVTLPAGQGEARVTFPRDRYPLAVAEEPGATRHLPVDTWVDFEVAHRDWCFEVRVAGEVWFRYELDPHPWTLVSKGVEWPRMFPVETTTIRLAAHGGRVAIENLGVDQDLHYTQPPDGVWDTMNYTVDGKKLKDGKIPEGHYFMMGDNSHGSRDSRLWHRIQVKEPGAEQLIWGEEYSWVLDSDRMHNENIVNFVDLYGNGYWINGYDRHAPTDTSRNPMLLQVEPYGLIPRDHLVGRAFFVFWPIPRVKYIR
jgi:signal peptidase I